MEIRVETPVFEGPLDLLVYLIEKRDLSIYDIPIAEITEEFLNYIYTMQELNIPLASEFLLMAATLARIKSEYLIPKDESEDPRKELVQIIEEYLKSKEAAKHLEKLEEEALKSYTHDPSDLIFQFQDRIKISNTVNDLKEAFRRVLEGRQKNGRVRIGIKISSETFKVSDKIDEIRKEMKEKYLIPFTEFLKRSSCKIELITYFLAVLELVRLGDITTFTDGKEIFISRFFPLSLGIDKISSDDFIIR